MLVRQPDLGKKGQAAWPRLTAGQLGGRGWKWLTVVDHGWLWLAVASHGSLVVADWFANCRVGRWVGHWVAGRLAGYLLRVVAG
jgi:hypothetical protein